MIKIKNTQRKIKVDTKEFKRKAELILKELGYEGFDLGVWFTSNETVRYYNKTYRSKDKATDVLSFPYHTNLKAGQVIKVKSDEDKNLGDLFISPIKILEDAKIMGIELEDRLDHILVHGICHLLGYDHYTPVQDKKMRILEEKLLLLVDAKYPLNH